MSPVAPSLRATLGAAMAATLLAPAASEGAIPPLSRAEASRYALIVEVAADGPGEGLAQTLSAAYGFDVRRLAGNRATSDAIAAAMEELGQRIRPFDEIFVHLALPVTRDRRLYFVPADAAPESPWTLVPAEELVRWLDSLPTGAALLTYPSCAEAVAVYGAAPEFELAPELGSKRPGPVDVLLVCAPETLRARLERSQDGAGQAAPAPVSWGADRVTEVIARVLSADASRRGGVESPALAASVGEALGLRAEVVRVPSYPEGAFRFAPAGSIADYEERYEAAATVQELSRVLEDLFAASQEDEELQTTLAGVASRVARDPMAGTVSRVMTPNEALELRLLAIDILARVDSEPARNALLEISQRAPDSPLVRGHALTRISRLTDLRARDLAALRASLGDPHPDVRELAANGLGVARDPGSIAPLSQLARRDPDPEVRLAALQALSALGSADREPLFIVALGDQDPAIRREAATALGRLGSSPEASTALLAALQDEGSVDVRQAAAFALGRTWSEETRSDVVRGLGRALTDSESVAAAAASGLGRVGGDAAERLLVEALATERRERVSVALIEALGRVAGPSSLRVLVGTADSESAAIRRAAVGALGELATTEVTGVLFQKLADVDPYVRGEAQKALDKRQVETAELLAAVRSPAEGVRVYAYRSLGERRVGGEQPTIVEALVRGLGDPSPEVRGAAIDGLAARPSPEALRWVESILLSGEVAQRQGAVAALGRMKGETSEPIVELLVLGIVDHSPRVRAEAAVAVANRGDTRGLPILFEALGDESLAVRVAVARALGAFLGEPEVSARLQEIAKGDPSPEVREAAISALRGTAIKR